MNRLPHWKSADWLALAALGLAAGMRIWGAWAMRCLTEPDPAVVGLMARHMAALKEFPVFFYGQAYMGSLEPMASALMVALLGSTGFAVNLGPVLFAMAAKVVLWRWARDAAGPWGGLAAVLAGLTGPAVYFAFQMAPRGGYMVALFVQALALSASARLAARLRTGEGTGAGAFFALGVVAGVGVWSNLIVAPALGASVLLLAHGMRWRFLRHAGRLAAGAAGTLAGLLPWLAYNTRHGWASLDMSQVSAHEPLRRALLHSWTRFLLLHDDGRSAAGPHLPWILALAVLLLAGAGAWRTWTGRREATPRQNYARAAALLFTIFFVWVYATSGFTRTPSARYWVPVVPGLAVLMAVGCATSRRRGARLAAWSLLAALMLGQGALSVMKTHPYARRAPACLDAFRQMGEALEQIGADALLAPLQLYALNFANDERVPVSDGRQTFYEPILRAAELADSPAYASGFHGIETLLRQRGASWKSLPVAGRHLIWKVSFPSEPVRFLAGGDLRDLSRPPGGLPLDALNDGNLDTWWSPSGKGDAALEWHFPEPEEIQSVQFVFAHGMANLGFDFPRRIRIEVNTGGAWRTLFREDPIVPLDVSGPRVYSPSGLARLTYRVAHTDVKGLRVTFLETRSKAGRLDWRLAEAGLIEATEEPERMADAGGVDGLGAWIREKGGEAQIFAPRWLSNRLYRGGVAERERLPGLAERVFGAPEGWPGEGAVMPDREVLFVVEPLDAEVTRATLEVHARAFQDSRVEGWAVFRVAAGDWVGGEMGLPPAVRWTGDALLTGHTVARVGEALRLLKAGGGRDDTRRALLAEMVRWRPSALSALPEETVRALGGEEAVRARRESALVPEYPCRTEFANGLCLEGVAVEPAVAEAGGEVVVTLHWSVLETFVPGREMVFVHVRAGGGKIVAQDDYRGTPQLWGDPAVRPVPGEIVAETRTLVLPEGDKADVLDLCVGLYSPRSGRRVRVVRSEAPEVRRQAATWPGRVRIDREGIGIPE